MIGGVPPIIRGWMILLLLLFLILLIMPSASSMIKLPKIHEQKRSETENLRGGHPKIHGWVGAKVVLRFKTFSMRKKTSLFSIPGKQRTLSQVLPTLSFFSRSERRPCQSHQEFVKAHLILLSPMVTRPLGYEYNLTKKSALSPQSTVCLLRQSTTIAKHDS